MEVDEMDRTWILVIAIVLFIAILLSYRWIIKRKHAINYVLEKSYEEKIREINNALDLNLI